MNSIISNPKRIHIIKNIKHLQSELEKYKDDIEVKM